MKKVILFQMIQNIIQKNGVFNMKHYSLTKTEREYLNEFLSNGSVKFHQIIFKVTPPNMKTILDMVNNDIQQNGYFNGKKLINHSIDTKYAINVVKYMIKSKMIQKSQVINLRPAHANVRNYINNLNNNNETVKNDTFKSVDFGVTEGYKSAIYQYNYLVNKAKPITDRKHKTSFNTPIDKLKEYIINEFTQQNTIKLSTLVDMAKQVGPGYVYTIANSIRNELDFPTNFIIDIKLWNYKPK